MKKACPRFVPARLIILIIVGLPMSAFGDNEPRPAAVFKDAVALWQFGGPANADVRVQGNVRLGIELHGDEKQASLERGGNGKVAEFDGGSLVLGDARRLSTLNHSKTMTLCMRVRDFQGEWTAPLLSMSDGGAESSAMLYRTRVDFAAVGHREEERIENPAALEFLWRTEPLDRRVTAEYMLKDPTGWFKILSDNPDRESFLKGRLRLQAPVDLIGSKGWHDVIVRFTGPKLEMFIDGVLVDEQWPHGAIYGLKGPLLLGAGYEKGQLKTGFHGQVEHVAFWNRAISDDEIAAISGGKKQIEHREIEILGPENPDAQYWRPRGYNAFVGDCMLFSHDGRLHLFYLFDRRHHRSKWGMGAHQFAHLSTRDLVHWEQHPMALSITDQAECSLGTGCCVFRDGVYYLFYIQHGKRALWCDAPYRGDNIFVATSTDCITFTKHPKPVIATEYMQTADVNPHVVPTADGKRYLMTVAGWKIYSSDNLLDWTEIDAPQLHPVNNIWGCTSNFDWNGWHYFTGCGNYVMSRKPIEDTRDWTIPSTAALGDAIGVPVVAQFGDHRYIYAGFATGNGKYGNELVFRELVQEKDGTLGMKWPEEMIPQSASPLPLAWRALKGDVSSDKNSVRLVANKDFSCAMAVDVTQNVRITLRARPTSAAQNFGLCVRGEADFVGGSELRFEPGAQRMQFRDGPAMEKVPGLDREFTIDMIVKDDLVDVCVGNRRTLLNRTSATGNRLFFFARNGEVTFDDIQVRPLNSQPKPPTVAAPGKLLFDNSDFERGDLTNWTAHGDAFDNVQPTKGDNTSARGARSIRQQGDYWIGSYERYDGRTGKPGDARGDAATGALESVEFTINEPYISFLISGGEMIDTEYVALIVDGHEVKRATGRGTETLRQVVWDVSAWRGRKAHILITDQSKAPWGLIDADDFRYCTPHSK